MSETERAKRQAAWRAGEEVRSGMILGELGWTILAAIPIGLLLGRLGAEILRIWHEHHIFFTTSMSIIKHLRLKTAQYIAEQDR